MNTMTKRQKEILELMAQGEELIVSGGQVAVGYESTNMRLFYSLLRKHAISQDCETANTEYWTINETGLSLIRKDEKPIYESDCRVEGNGTCNCDHKTGCLRFN